MRYFYTDPLAAAWMWKHFRMKFSDIIFQRDVAYYEKTGRQARPDKFYIHPDSVKLLEPQVGDMITISAGKTANVATNQDYLDTLNRDAERFVAPLKIIQRNGIAFMWPEMEK